MTRLITKQMRSSFKISSGVMLRKIMASRDKAYKAFYAKGYFESTKKQRILTLKKVVK